MKVLRHGLTALAALSLACAPEASDERLLRYFTSEEIAGHDAYLRPLYERWWWEQLAWAAFLALFLGLGLGARLERVCQRVATRWADQLGRIRPLASIGRALSTLWGDATWGGAVLFVVAFSALVFAIELPADFYFGWIYERRNGLSVATLGRWWGDAAQGWVLSSASLAALVFGMYGLARRLRRWWLWLGLPCAVLMLGAGVLDPARVALYHDFVPVPEGAHRGRIVEVLQKAGLEYEGVYGLKVSDVTRRVNAFLVGEGPSRRIAVWDTMLRSFSPDEVGNVVAHEIGHLRDRSPGRLVLSSLAIVPFLWLLAGFLRRLGRSGRWGFRDDRDVASLPAAFFLVWALTLAVSPASNALSRHLERRADRHALELLEQPRAFRSMMVKLARANRTDLHPPAWVVWMLGSHPDPLERIEAAERFARERGIPLEDPASEAPAP